MDEFPFIFDPHARNTQLERYAKEGAEHGSFTLGLGYTNGIVLLSKNEFLNEKTYAIHEIHHAIAFAGAGKVSDITRVRERTTDEADVAELYYSAQDVRAKELADTVISPLIEEHIKLAQPFQAVFLLAEIESHRNMFYKVLFDGDVMPSEEFASIGGKLSDEYTNWIEDTCKQNIPSHPNLKDAILFGIDCLTNASLQTLKKQEQTRANVFHDVLGAGKNIEVIVLDRIIADTSKFAPLSKTRLRNEHAPITQEQLEEIFEQYGSHLEA